MHESISTTLTILTIVAAALLNRSDSRRLETRSEARFNSLEARFDALSREIVSIRERLARIEERIGIKAAAS